MKTFLIKLSKSSNYEIEVLEYGLKVIFFNIISILTILLLSYFADNFLFGVTFLLSFCTIRIKIGGFHCKTIISCLISFSTLYIFNFFLSFNTFYQQFLYFIFLPCIILLIYFLKKECPNNRVKYWLPSIYILVAYNIDYLLFLAFSSGLYLGIILKIIKLVNKS